MFSAVLILGILATIVGAVVAARKRDRRWLLATLPFALIPLAIYLVIVFACIFGSNCP